ncbi:MAG TPA: glutathione-disulfide reductase [Sandaracinaceae bacterium]
MAYDYDLFVIGAGSGGVRASRMAARRGARVAIAEARFVGGTCVNVGCIPKKLFVYAAEMREELQDMRRFGWSPGEARFDWPTLVASKDAEVQRLNEVYERLLHGSGVQLIRGRARIVDPHTVEIAAEGETLRASAERILVATGSRPVRPTEPGTERAWVSDDVFYLRELPKRLLVVGGGYIALEMASIFAGLGTHVTLAYRGPHVLRGFDDDARFFLADELRKKGITICLNTSVQLLEDGPGGSIVAVLSHEETCEVDAVLYAIGRVPNTEGLGLEEVGVRLNDAGAIVVDERFATSVPSIYALGDVTARKNLTPVALAEAMAFVATAFGKGAAPIRYDTVPTAVFTIPPLACVGLSEADARARYGDVHVYTSEFRPLKHTVSGNDERAFMKLIVHPETDRVLGVHIVGKDAPEIIQGFAVALTCGATKAQLDATIGLHPTAAEELVTMRERRPDE